MDDPLTGGGSTAPPAAAPGNTLAIVALAVGAGAAGVALLPFTGMVAAPLGAVALALGVVGIVEGGRRGRRAVAVAGTALGGVALLAGVAWAMTVFGWLSPFGMFTGHGGHMGMAQESATLEAAPGPDVSPAPEPPPPSGGAGEDRAGHQEVRPDRRQPATVVDGTGQATVTLDDETAELALRTCETGGRMSDRYLRGRGPDGRLAVDRAMGRMLLVVDADDRRHTLVGRQRRSSASGGRDEGVTFEASGEMTDVLTGELVDVELQVECS